MPLLVAWIQSKPDVQQLLRILGLHDYPRETCFYPLSYCFPSMNHTHITRNLCLHSFDSNYLCCQVYNSVLEWHAIVGIRVTVGIVCGLWESANLCATAIFWTSLTRWGFTVMLRPAGPQLRFCLDSRESLSRQLSVWPVAPDSSGTVTLDPAQGRQRQLPGFTWHCQWKDGAFKIKYISGKSSSKTSFPLQIKGAAKKKN